MTPWAVLGVAAVTLATASASLAAVRPQLLRRQIVDVPNHRSLHTEATVRGGGLGVVAGIVAGLGLGLALMSGEANDIRVVGFVAVVTLLLAGVGLAEDVRGLSVAARLTLQASAFVLGTAFLMIAAGLPALLGAATALAGVFYVNAANFMDGVNGISGLHGGVVGSYFAAVGYLSSQPGLAVAGIVVAVAFIGFLPWNIPRPRMFLGDVGSYALGGAAWAFGAAALAGGASLITVAAPFLVYSVDVAFTLARRAHRGAPLTEAHREHVFQRVHGATGSHAAATGTVTGATILCAGAGLWNLAVPASGVWAITGCGLVLAAFVVSPALALRLRGQTKPRVEAGSL